MSRSSSWEQLRSQPRGAASPLGHQSRGKEKYVSEQNKTIVRRLLEEPWTGNLKVVDELIDRKYVGHDPALPSRCAAPTVQGKHRDLSRGLLGRRITVDEQIAEGDKVATRWTGRGKHDGDLMGIGPTGKQVTVSGLTLSRLENAR